MDERALKYFLEAWKEIKSGNLFDESVNNNFDYMLKSLWKTTNKDKIKLDILKHLPNIFEKSRGLPNPPPVLYILISLKDENIIKEIQTLALADWIKSSASEDSTFQLIHMVETFTEKQINVDGFIATIVKHIKESMNKDMIEALSYMLSVNHPDTMKYFIKKFLTFSNEDFLKDYLHMNGRKAVMTAMQIATPVQMNKLLKTIKKN